jgi:GT2 family glycosyltransferase
MPNVAVSIVEYMSEADTSRLIDTLLDSQSPPTHIAVTVSGDDAAVGLEKYASKGVLINRPGFNTGYGLGHNLAIREALAQDVNEEIDWLLMLNPDIDLGSFDRLVGTVFDGGSPPSDVGAFAPRIDYPDGSTWYLGANIDAERSGFPSHIVEQRSEEAWLDTAYACGAATFISPAAFEDVGGLPEHYFLYFEEPDLGMRLRESGYRVMVRPDAVVHHDRAWTVPPAHYLYYFARNFFHFAYTFDFGSPSDAREAITPWLRSQRRRVLARRPTVGTAFDELAQRACHDGQRLVTGRSQLVSDAGW